MTARGGGGNSGGGGKSFTLAKVDATHFTVTVSGSTWSSSVPDNMGSGDFEKDSGLSIIPYGIVKTSNTVVTVTVSGTGTIKIKNVKNWGMDLTQAHEEDFTDNTPDGITFP